MALTLDPATILVLALVALICRFGYLNLFSLTRVPKEIPWIGTEKYIFFSRARAMLASIFHTRELCEDGYNKVRQKFKTISFCNQQIIANICLSNSFPKREKLLFCRIYSLDPKSLCQLPSYAGC